MSVGNPVLLAVGLLIVAALGYAAILTTRRRAAMLTAAGMAAAGRRHRRQAGTWLTIGGLAVLAAAVSGPTAALPVQRASGTVIIAMDVSGSMGASDVSPNRLAAAQRAALAFVQAQPDSLDIGVVAFEEGALTTAKPSGDHSIAASAIQRLAITGGTSLGAAIIASLAAITGKPVTAGPGGSVPSIGYWPSATILMFSDGGEQPGGLPVNTATAIAAKAGVHVDTVGVGTTAGTTVDVDGFHVHTALDAQSLTSIARETGGSYHPASTASQLNGLASTINLRLTVTRQPVPLAGALIAAALVLLAAGALLTVLRSGRVI
jgi:Ca-activated chloride channel family protein